MPVGRLNMCTRIYENADILIDTPINETFVLDLVDPPYGDGEPEDPTVTATFLFRERVWYDFDRWVSGSGPQRPARPIPSLR